MVDQAPVKPSTNGQESPPQAVARTSLEFLHDLMTLAELQSRLFTVDLQQGFKQAVVWVVILFAGACLALACVPLCLAAAALCLNEYWNWPLPIAFGTAVLAGLLLAAGMVGLGLAQLRGKSNFLERSWQEWRQNVRWVKETLRRLSTSHVPRGDMPFPPSKAR